MYSMVFDDLIVYFKEEQNIYFFASCTILCDTTATMYTSCLDIVRRWYGPMVTFPRWIYFKLSEWAGITPSTISTQFF